MYKWTTFLYTWKSHKSINQPTKLQFKKQEKKEKKILTLIL